MSKYRNELPQINGDLFLTDAGLETDGSLPTGQPLSEAIDAVDNATDGAADLHHVAQIAKAVSA